MIKRRRIPLFILILIFSFIAIVMLAMLAPVIAPVNLGATALENRLIKPRFLEPSSKYLFGTDGLGRDLATRLLYAINQTVSISFTGMFFALLIGTVLGILSGMLGGAVDHVIMFLTELRLSIPTTLIGIVFATILGPRPFTTILVISLTGWSGFCRLIRSQILQLKNAPFIEASQSIGAGKIRISFEHILRNIASPLIVQATLSMSGFILLESTLSFLGLGITPPDTSLGIMVSDGRDFMLTHWWLTIIPSIVIILLILQVSLIGDWLRDVLDPKLRMNR